MKSLLRVLLPWSLLIFFAGHWAVAQNRPQMMPRQAMERAEQFKKMRMLEVLKLDEETSLKFIVRYNEHRDAIREIQQKQEGIVKQAITWRAAKVSNADYEKALQELQDLEQLAQDTKKKYIDKLHEILSAKQIFEYLVFELKFTRELMNIMRDAPRPMRQMQ
ncbi:MAG: hypothetical protein V1799_17905 [bacterium]